MTSGLDVASIKSDFPILQSNPGGKRIIYLDSAASAQRPQAVLDAMDDYYSTTHANVHRGVYEIAEQATALFEAARVAFGRFIGAPDPEKEVIFTKNATEAINLVAHSWGRRNLSAGDAILLTEMEHHANIVPWLMLAEERGFAIRYIPVDSSGRLDLSNLDKLLDGVKLVGVTLASNVLGTLNPVAHLAEAAHRAGALLLADGAQFVPHLPTEVSAIGCDFLAATGHKMMGPTGIGMLWARREILEAMPPFLGGGEMISDVRLDGFTPNELPWKFEAGTPPIAEAVGLGAAISYLDKLNMSSVREHEVALLEYALGAFSDAFGDDLKIFGPLDAQARSGVISFSYKDLHPHDISQVLDSEGVCIRAGHHCAKPLMRRIGVGATARASFYVYNDETDVDLLVKALAKADEFFRLG
ncbi:MAG TPA: cysteine desulfurase [Acidimicrobiales bacterium]|nr:cysteine desulfurase [Acidimicrobiales bacterium]